MTESTPPQCKPPDDIRTTWIGRRVLDLLDFRSQTSEEIIKIKSTLTDVNRNIAHLSALVDQSTREAALREASAKEVRDKILAHLEREKEQRLEWYRNEAKRKHFSARRFEYARWIFVMLCVLAVLSFMHLLVRIT